jgi:hypothetical protein
MPRVRYSFALHPIKDADVIRWLELQPNITSAIRKALSAYIERPSHADLADRLDMITSMVNALRFAPLAHQSEGEAEEGEPEQAAQGFDKMLSKFRST